MSNIYDERGNRIGRLEGPGFIDSLTDSMMGWLVLAFLIAIGSFFIFYWFFFQLGRVGWQWLTPRFKIIGGLVCLLFSLGLVSVLNEAASKNEFGDGLVGVGLFLLSAAAAYGIGWVVRMVMLRNAE